MQLDKVNEEKERLEFELSNAVRYVFNIHGFIGGGGGGGGGWVGGGGSCGSCGPMRTAWKVGGGGLGMGGLCQKISNICQHKFIISGYYTANNTRFYVALEGMVFLFPKVLKMYFEAP